MKITCISESSLFGINLIKISSENDPTYNSRRYLLANLMQHEDFGHINFSINFYAFYDKNIRRPSSIHNSENLSPFKYYMINKNKENMQEIVREIKIRDKNKGNGQKENNIIKGESGIALAFFLTRGKYKLMKVLKKQVLISLNYLKNLNFKRQKILQNLLIN